MTRLSVLALLGALTAQTLGLPSQRPYAVHERRDALPSSWIKVSRATPGESIDLRIGLNQRNLEYGYKFVSEIADPESPSYGNHWTPQQVIETFMPSDEAFDSTISWLVDFGISPKRIIPSAGRNWLKVSSNVSEAEALLRTQFNVYRLNDGVEHVACEEYSVPKAIQEHIDLISPTIQFDVRTAEARNAPVKRDGLSPKGYLKIHPPKEPASLQNCSEQTTPACVRALYHIPETNVPAPKNSLGVVEYSPQSYSQADLDVFFSKFTHIANGTGPILEQIDGGYLSNATDSGTRGESNLDLEYAMSLVYPQQVTLYQTGDNDAANPATADNFLDAIDGSYCTYEGGDNPDWDAIYPHNETWMAGIPGLYKGEPQCGTVNATKVISISYGRNEDSHPASYNARECSEYMKLGLMGVSILNSSGDSGVAGLRGQCVNPDGSYTPISADYGRFNPMFPGTCPYVTSVGGTSIPPNGTVHDPEVATTDFGSSGGFSDEFPIPDFQKAVIAEYYKLHDPGYNASVYNNSRAVRGYPDIAANGQNFVITVDGAFMQVSGTSASSPVAASIVTLLNAERMKAGKSALGFLNPLFYKYKDVLFNDVTEGNNPGCGTEGFQAVKGWDPVTGLGTLDFERAKALVLRLP